MVKKNKRALTSRQIDKGKTAVEHNIQMNRSSHVRMSSIAHFKHPTGLVFLGNSLWTIR